MGEGLTKLGGRTTTTPTTPKLRAEEVGPPTQGVAQSIPIFILLYNKRPPSPFKYPVPPNKYPILETPPVTFILGSHLLPYIFCCIVRHPFLFGSA
jgi:hypothetical protein